MPRLDSDVKLDFKDVLVRPKRSTLKSRAEVSRGFHKRSCSLAGIFSSFLQVDLHREFIFRNSKKTYNGVPIIASNMDTVGTFEMAAALSEVCLSRSMVV
jgi:GMP reductase